MHTAFLLAAGFGTRLRPLTEHRPKPLMPMCGVPMLNYTSALLRSHGHERILVNSSADWGPSDPFTLQECIMDFRRRGHALQDAIEIFHNNPCRFLGQNPKFDIKPIRVIEEHVAADDPVPAAV